MDTKQIIQTINDLIETPEHSKIRWYVEKQALDLIDKLETKQLIIADVVGRSEQLKCLHDFTEIGLVDGVNTAVCLKCGDNKAL